PHEPHPDAQTEKSPPAQKTKNSSMALSWRVFQQPVRAFSSEGDAGSREENASKQKPRARF
ncbi:hypothetical protein PY365_28285, partial [Roseiarcaceae bacterium H3SJ34-1]|uniref:hypothetical protein n=1 Tax=Terripilifer ovatus TaxID=3032367 RepID=UPI003AB96E10|nr:hypothetical protein [Roseiarcaceae bacterium H3SJ34-1]